MQRRLGFPENSDKLVHEALPDCTFVHVGSMPPPNDSIYHIDY